MLHIDTQIVLQSRQSNGSRRISPSYLFARKRGELVTIGLSSRPETAPIRIVLTVAAVKRLENTLKLIGSIGRDLSIGIWPPRHPARKHAKR